MIKITVTNEKDTVEIEYDSHARVYHLYNLENPNYKVGLYEEELEELKRMIDEILQHVNKRDY